MNRQLPFGRLSAVLVITAISGFCVSGCSKQGVALYPVSGIIVWSDGQPAKELAGGAVGLQAIGGASPAVSPQGVVDADGGFTLRSPGLGTGAAAGKYRAIVMPARRSAGPLQPVPPPVMDRRFENYATSGLEVTIESKSTQITLKVARVAKH